MKIFAFVKSLEFLNLLLNKCNNDFDVQLYLMIKETKIKKKLICLLIQLISLFLNIVTFWSYMICLSIILNDPGNMIYPLVLKLNYFGMKKSGKSKKKKKIMDLIHIEVYDRFFTIFSLLAVIIQNYNENKINSHNFLDYFQRVFYFIFAEILFDWIRNIITFKISQLKPNIYKQITLEMILLHEKLKFNSINQNGGNDHSMMDSRMITYLRIIEEGKIDLITKKKDSLKYTKLLDTDNAISLILQTNSTTYCILLVSYLFQKFGFFSIKFVLIILLLLVIRKNLQISFSHYILDNKLKCYEFEESGSESSSDGAITNSNIDENEELNTIKD
jgi:hypothetical protein